MRGRDLGLALGDFASSFARREGKPRLLVVDDQAIHLQLLHQLFEAECQVLVATSGERALALCREQAPDLVLLDVVMPGMDGFEVCARIKADPATRDIPVIFLTARSDPQEETRGLELGAVDFIAKPINPAVVRARVRTHLALKRHNDNMQRLAFLDGLTGVYNRRYLDHQLAMEVGRSRRQGAPLALVMVDVDHFKAYNDHYGHLAGDDALRLVARTLAEGFRRPADVLARFGGEEFVGILPDTDFASALHHAQNLEAQVRALGVPHAAAPGSGCLTVSIGVTALQDGLALEPTELMELADAQLYQAKKAGRGCVRGALDGGVELLGAPGSEAPAA